MSWASNRLVQPQKVFLQIVSFLPHCVIVQTVHIQSGNRQLGQHHDVSMIDIIFSPFNPPGHMLTNKCATKALLHMQDLDVQCDFIKGTWIQLERDSLFWFM